MIRQPPTTLALVTALILALGPSSAFAAGDRCAIITIPPPDRDHLLEQLRRDGPEALNFYSLAAGRSAIDHILERSYGVDFRTKGAAPPALRCRAEIDRQAFMLLVDLRNLKFSIDPDVDFPPIRFKVRMNWLQRQCAAEPAAATAVLRMSEDATAAFDDWRRLHPDAKAAPDCVKDFG